MTWEKYTRNQIINYFIICLFIIISFCSESFPQSSNPKFITPVFENISIEDGLPENSVTCILQDHLGYLWLGTQNGLVKYDGYSMKIFQPEENDNSSISGRRITVIFEDKKQCLWIGTLNGLNKFNRASETFKSYRYGSKDSNSVNSNEIYSIYEDHTGKFWVGTAEGLNLFNTKKETFTRFYFRYGDKKVYKSSKSYFENLCVNAITEDSFIGNLLLGTAEDGLWEFNLNNKTLSQYRFNNIINPNKKIGWIQSLYKSSNGIIWMTSFHSLCSLDPQKKVFNSYIEFPIKKEERFTKRDMPMGGIVEDKNGSILSGFYAGAHGMFCVDTKTKSFKNYTIDPDVSKNSYGNHIFCVYRDRSNIIWIGSWGLGLWKWDKRKIKFQLPFEEHYNFTNLNNTTANSLAYDPKGFIWLVSHQGLEKYDLINGKFNYYLQNEISITQDNVYTTFIDKSGNIWIGTFSKGLIKFNPTIGSHHFLFNNPNELVNLANKIILLMHQDNLGFIWIGTDGYGYYKYDLTKNKLTQFKNNPNDSSSLTNNSARSFYEDRQGTLWFGTNFGGLNKFERKTETFKYCGFNCVLSIYEDKNGNFWIADYYTGLNLFDRKTNKVIECFGRKDGLISNSIWGILEDNNNNLWLKTDNGLFKFNTTTKIIKRYTKEDGISDNFFLPYSHSHCKGPNETMLFINSKFRSHNGIVIFNADSIKDDPIPPKTIITKISLFNKPEEKINIKGIVSELKEITLPYNQNDLRFDFVGIQFSEPNKNKYKYFLENFDEDWVNAGYQRNATYTNLSPGNYIFKVLASNRDGVWNKKGASLKIIITPPWWKTNLAYSFFALFFFGTIYFIWKMQMKRIKIKHEYEMNRFETEKLHEVDELKSRFFTNISHEFRTPLTLILGPVKQMIDETKEKRSKEKLSVIHKNAKRLLNLVNQLLEISKLESGNMKLRTSPQNIIPFLKTIVISFTSYAERKNITLKFETSEEEIIVYFDKEKIEKIINNVLSNAFKFTPEGGRIIVKAESKDNFFTLSISDTGVGIPKEKIAKIFDRFYQVDHAHNKEYEGTGIGLAFTKELLELHKGTIEVESIEGKGTTFKINIPLGKDHLKPEEIINSDNDNLLNIRSKQISEESTINNKLNFISENGKPLLLIIEDNL